MTAVTPGTPAAAERLLVEDRTPLLLDVLMGLSVVAGLGVVWSYVRDPAVGPSWAGGYLALVVAMVVVWTVRRLRQRRPGRPQRALVVVLDVLGVANLFLGGGSGAWPLFLVALLTTVIAFGLRSGAVLGAVVVLAQVVAFLAGGRPVDDVLLEATGTTFVFAFALLLASLLVERVRQRQRIAGLLSEVQHGVATEIELALADERTRAARELHDGLAHRLTLIGMTLTFAERTHDRDPGAAWVQVERARVEAGEALSTMRLWVRALSPARVEGASLGEALDAIAESFRGTGLQVVVGQTSGAGEAELDRAATVFVHRFVQECLTNALRHASATRVEVTYALAGDRISIEVSDDGSPGPVDRPAPAPGFGLRMLGERAAQLDGDVTAAWSSAGLAVRADLARSERAA